MTRLLLLAALIGGAVGCTSGEDVAPIGPAFVDFTGGQFQLYVQTVDDKCLDGALEVLFMPEGNNTAYALKNVSFIPGLADLPSTYILKLQAPFEDMSITMASDNAGGMQVINATQSAVLLGVPGSEDCRGDIDFGGTVRIDSATQIALEVTATLTNLSSVTQTCPPLETHPCAASLAMTGVRE